MTSSPRASRCEPFVAEFMGQGDRHLQGQGRADAHHPRGIGPAGHHRHRRLRAADRQRSRLGVAAAKERARSRCATSATARPTSVRSTRRSTSRRCGSCRWSSCARTIAMPSTRSTSSAPRRAPSPTAAIAYGMTRHRGRRQRRRWRCGRAANAMPIDARPRGRRADAARGEDLPLPRPPAGRRQPLHPEGGDGARRSAATRAAPTAPG